MATQSIYNFPASGRARSSTTVLTNDDILNLTTVPVAVVPSLGPRHAAIFTSANLVGNFGAASYGNISNDALLYIGTANSFYRSAWLANTADAYVEDVTNFFGVNGADTYLATIPRLVDFDPADLTLGSLGGSILASNLAGQPLYLMLQNTAGPLSDGDPANTLTVYCDYTVISF